MDIVVDCGTSTSNWAFIKGSHSLTLQSAMGFNPNYQDFKSFDKSLIAIQKHVREENINTIFFYGSGLASVDKQKIVESRLQIYFEPDLIEVNHDLLGAARALCNKDKGLVGILGTGANSCIYNGKEISKNVTSVGYLMQDEGSGVLLASKFIKAVIRNEVPYSIKKLFFEKYDLNERQLLESIYSSEYMIRDLASYNSFIFEHRDDEFLSPLITKHFGEFAATISHYYTNDGFRSLNLVGSIAYYFKDFIKSELSKVGFSLGRILQSPIIPLSKYHFKNIQDNEKEE